MQAVSAQLDATSRSNIRKMKWRVLASFDKSFDVGTQFFKIGSSLIGGSDVIKGSGNVLQEWDKYSYKDYSDRVISIEYSRELDQPIGGLVLGMADIVFDNTDGFFTPDNAGPIGQYIIPARPFRIHLGFDTETVPIFVGLSVGLPKIDISNSTATFHCVDFMQSIYNLPMLEAGVYTDQNGNTLIDNLLQTMAGLSYSQYSLEPSYNPIWVAFFEKNSTLGPILRGIAQGEGGSLLMDESGQIQFWNRLHLSKSQYEYPVLNIDKTNAYEIEAPSADNVINYLNINSDIRQVLDFQSVYSYTGSEDNTIQIASGDTFTQFFDFEDPVVNVENPFTHQFQYQLEANNRLDGSGVIMDGYISIDDYYLFNNAIKVTFRNNGDKPAFITKFEIFGQPAKVVKKIRLKYTDDDSIAKYGESHLEITNNFIQSVDFAYSYSQLILQALADLGGLRNVRIPGLPHLQIGDTVALDDGGGIKNYSVIKINGLMNLSDGFSQRLTLLSQHYFHLFTVGVSKIGDTDIIAP